MSVDLSAPLTAPAAKPMPSPMSSFLLYERWSDAERKLGAAYARAAEQTLVRWLADLGRSTVALDDGKRASVEIAALLDLAAKIAQDRLRLSADEFATAACDIFIKDQL